MMPHARAMPREVLEAVGLRAKQTGIECGVRHVPDRYAADGILESAEEVGCDLIVMASHGRRGIARFVLGSDAMRFL